METQNVPLGTAPVTDFALNVRKWLDTHDERIGGLTHGKTIQSLEDVGAFAFFGMRMRKSLSNFSVV